MTRKEILTPATKWMNLKRAVLSYPGVLLFLHMCTPGMTVKAEADVGSCRIANRRPKRAVVLVAQLK